MDRRIAIVALVFAAWMLALACKPIPSAAPILDDEDVREAAPDASDAGADVIDDCANCAEG
jgi:hypothetical protein